MAFSTSSGDDDVLSEINITPLVDVMLVLLVAFIVTAPLMSHALKINLPRTEASAPAPQTKAVVVSIDGKGQLYIDSTPTTTSALAVRLSALSQASPDQAVTLQADEGVAYREVAKAMAEIQKSGISKLNVLTAPAQ